MLRIQDCYLPRGSELEEEGLGGNREYEYFGDLTWQDAQEAFRLERNLLERMIADDCEERSKDRFMFEVILNGDVNQLTDDQIADAVYDEQAAFSDAELVIYRLDIGCAAAVSCLYAAGCAPIASCNGGAFGGRHQYGQPTIAFYANRKCLSLLNDSAKKAAVRLDPSSQGIPLMVASSVDQFSDFAALLLGSLELNP